MRAPQGGATDKGFLLLSSPSPRHDVLPRARRLPSHDHAPQGERRTRSERLPPHRRTTPAHPSSTCVDSGRSGIAGAGRARHSHPSSVGECPVTRVPFIDMGAGSIEGQRMSSQGDIPRRGLPHIGRIARFRSAPKSDRVAPECASNRLSRARPTTGTPYTREKWTPMIGQGDKWSCPDSVSGVSRVRGCFARCFGISIPPFVFPGTSLPLFCHVPTPSEIKKRTIVRFSSCPPPAGRSPPPVHTRGNVGTPHRRLDFAHPAPLPCGALVRATTADNRSGPTGTFARGRRAPVPA